MHVATVPYGRPASEALSAAVVAAKRSAALDPVTVIVASNFAGLAARRLLGAGTVGPGGLVNVNFVTPFRLAELLAAEQLLGQRPLTNPVLGAAVRLALELDPGPFESVRDHLATEAALASLYAELSNVSGPALERAAADGGSAGRTAVAMSRRIASPLGSFHGEADVARAAARHPDLSRALASFGQVIWYLPAPLTSPMAEFVSVVLSTAGASVIVGITQDAHADEAVWQTCERAGVVRPAATGGRRGSLRIIAGESSSAQVPTGDVIVSVTDADEEVRTVVRRIVELVESGIRLDRIGVFHPMPNPYVGILSQQFAAACIPANGPAPGRLTDSVAGATLLGALALPAQSWRRDRVMALVSGGPIRDADGPVFPSAWETLSRRAGVVQGLPDWRGKLASRKDALESAIADAATVVAVDESLTGGDISGAAAEGRRRRAQRDLKDANRLLAFVETLAASIAAMDAAIGWHAKAMSATALLHFLLGPGHRHSSWPVADQAAFELVESALSRLASLDELEPSPSRDTFVRALSGELDVPRARNGRFGEGVMYGPLATAVGHDLDAVFILGCAEGLCPSPRRDDAMLPDAVRALTDGELTLRSEHLAEQHRWFLAALASAPDGQRVLTFARGDLRGSRRALPSRWLLDTASALAGRTVYSTEFEQLGAPVVDVVPSHAAGLRSARVHGSLLERDLSAVSLHLESGSGLGELERIIIPARGLEAQLARRSHEFTEWDGNLGGQPIPSTSDRSLSPTSLQTWAACGFRYYLSRVLRLSDRDEPEALLELSPLDRGSGVHLALETFIAEAIEAGVPLPTERWSVAQHDRLQSLAGEVFSEYERTGRTGRPVHWQLMKGDLLELLDDFLYADDRHRRATGSRPVQVEMPFGIDGAAPVMVAIGDGRQLSFRGYADRVDRTDDGRFYVSDYKTGKGKEYSDLADGDPVQGGATLQLGLYAEAVTQLLGATAVDARYWLVNSAAGLERRGYLWNAARRERMVDVLTAMADGIEDGVFAAVPGEWDSYRSTHGNCTYCEFDSVCPQARGEQADLKVHAPELKVRDALVWEPAE